MKNKNFQLFIFTFLLLIFSSNVNAKALSFDNTLLNKYVTKYKELKPVTVDKNKEFTITFNREIAKISINRDTIKVLDSKGQDVNVSIVTRTDNNKVAVVRPNESYIEGETYALIVRQGVMDIKNLKLFEEVVLKFTIKSVAADPQPGETINKSADELFLDSLYKKNSPFWNYGAKFVDGKLNLNFYDYTTQKSSWETLSTNFNPNINNQILAIFKALYIEKEGYQTYIEYGGGEDGSGIGSIKLYGKDLTPWGEEFINIDLYTSGSATIIGKDSFASLSIPQCSADSFNQNKYIIKNALVPLVGDSNVSSIYNYLVSEYQKCVLDNSYNITSYKMYNTTLGNIKVTVWSNGKIFTALFNK